MTTQTTTKLAVLTGDTFRFKSILKANGWKWDAARTAWTLADDWSDEAHVMRRVRGYAGIRNRGTFSVELA